MDSKSGIVGLGSCGGADLSSFKEESTRGFLLPKSEEALDVVLAWTTLETGFGGGGGGIRLFEKGFGGWRRRD